MRDMLLCINGCFMCFSSRCWWIFLQPRMNPLLLSPTCICLNTWIVSAPDRPPPCFFCSSSSTSVFTSRSLCSSSIMASRTGKSTLPPPPHRGPSVTVTASPTTWPAWSSSGSPVTSSPLLPSTWKTLRRFCEVGPCFTPSHGLEKCSSTCSHVRSATWLWFAPSCIWSWETEAGSEPETSSPPSFGCLASYGSFWFQSDYLCSQIYALIYCLWWLFPFVIFSFWVRWAVQVQVSRVGTGRGRTSQSRGHSTPFWPYWEHWCWGLLGGSFGRLCICQRGIPAVSWWPLMFGLICQAVWCCPCCLCTEREDFCFVKKFSHQSELREEMKQNHKNSHKITTETN